MDYLTYLPIEITLDILSRLPTECVLDCKLVSKTWGSFVRHPSFSRMHLNHPDNSGMLGFITHHTSDTKFHYFEYDENHDSTSPPIQRIKRINLTSPFNDSTSFIGSCNGLICLARGPVAWICNPITRESVKLPQITEKSCDIGRCGYWTCGFGYVSSTDEYKIVVVYTFGYKYIQVYVYTLGTGNGWKSLGKFKFGSSRSWGQGVYANGALYWLDNKLEKIITFDLKEENFCEHLSPPPLPTHGNWWDYYIGVVNGCLYCAVRHRLSVSEGGIRFDIWLLEKKSVDHEMLEEEEHPSCVWSKQFRIDQSRFFFSSAQNTLFAITENRGVLTNDGSCVSIYDRKTSTSKSLVKFKDYIRRVTPHKNTFVSLKELGEENIKTMESIELRRTTSQDYALEQLDEDANPEYT